MANIDWGAVHTLKEVATRHDPDGKYADMVDNFTGSYPMIQEGNWVEANKPNLHVFTQIVNEPAIQHGKVNKGILATVAGTKHVEETFGSLVDKVEIDSRVLDKVANAEQYWADEVNIHARAMGKRFHQSALYGNLVGTPDPSEINGIAKRLNALSMVANVQGNGGGGSDLTSIYVFKWGKKDLSFFHNQGEAPIPKILDRKEVDIDDPDVPGATYPGWRTYLMFDYGLYMGKDTSVQRICNIEHTGGANLFNEDLLIEALERFDDLEGVVIYSARKIITQVRIALKDKPNVHYDYNTAWGRKVLTFDEVPWVRCDGVKLDESEVT